jgi:cytochrome c biogenesis protein CcmG/thiol:disulfide interchange protein DsbE
VGSRLGVFVVLGLVAFGAAVVLLAQPVNAPYVDAGVEAPTFTLPRLDGEAPLTLESLRGRVVLLNFWATWCKPCEDEMASMERLYQRLEGEPFELVAVSVDAPGAPVGDFRTRYSLTFPILLDPGKSASLAYQTIRYPESFLVGADGVVVERYIGPRTWDAPEYERRIRQLTAVLR